MSGTPTSGPAGVCPVRTNHHDMTRLKLTKLFASTAALALVGSLLAAPASATTSAPRETGAACSAAVLVLRSLHVTATPSKKVVKPGDKFTVDVTVTRPAHEDPVGE